MWSLPFLPKLKPIMQVSRLKALSRVDTTVSREMFRGSTSHGEEVYGQLPNGLIVCFAHGHRRTQSRSIVGGSMFSLHMTACVKLRVGEGRSDGLSAGLPGSGSEGVERCPSPPCAGTSLLISRRPALLTPPWVIPVASGTVPSFT